MSAVATSVPVHGQVERAIAAYGLAGTMLDLPAEPLDRLAFARVLSQVRAQRISGLMWQAVVDGALPVTAEQAEQAESLHVQALSATLVLERLLLETVDVLESRSIPVRALKGSAVAHLDYPDPGLRTFGDIDLLVPGAAFDDAVSCLTRAGHERLHPQPRPGFDRRFSKGTSFRTADGLEIDLHRTFTMGPFGVRLALSQLWETHDEFVLGGRTVRALSTEERFLHACYHAVLGEVKPRLVPLRDAAQIALTRPLDVGRLHDLIRASRGDAVVSRAVRLAWREFELVDVLAISAWAQAYRTDPREAADLAAYGRGSSYTTKSLAALRALPTMSQRASYLYALLVPTNSYVGQRHHGRVSRLRSGVRQAGRVRRLS